MDVGSQSSRWDDEIFDDNNGFRNFSDIVSTFKVFRITEFYENFETILHFRNLHSLEGAIILFFRRYIYKVDLFYIFSY